MSVDAYGAIQHPSKLSPYTFRGHMESFEALANFIQLYSAVSPCWVSRDPRRELGEDTIYSWLSPNLLSRDVSRN